MDKLYKIKPLEWTDGNNGECLAQTSFGTYAVDNGYWGYFFGYYCEANFNSGPIEAGKAAADAHWRERIIAALVEVEAGDDGR